MFGLYHELRDFGRSVTACICCFLVGGPILLIVGIALLVSAGTDTRGNSISQYNGAVSTWTLSGAGRVANLTSGGQFSVEGDTTRNLAFTTANADYPSVESGGDVSSYSTRATVAASQSGGAPFSQQYWTNTGQSRVLGALRLSYAPTVGAAKGLVMTQVPVWAVSGKRWACNHL